MAEAQSVTTFVMGAQLPWPDDALAADALGSLDPVILHAAGQRRPCAIRKISTLGTTIRGTVTQAPGEEVAVELATGQRPVGTIDWIAGGDAGIRFKQPIDMLAAEAGMSTRTFLRRFKAATGLPPGEWLLGERLIRARELLETTRNSIEDIAGATGFGSAATLRHHFRSRLGTSPAAYRSRFAQEARTR